MMLPFPNRWRYMNTSLVPSASNNGTTVAENPPILLYAFISGAVDHSIPDTAASDTVTTSTTAVPSTRVIVPPGTSVPRPSSRFFSPELSGPEITNTALPALTHVAMAMAWLGVIFAPATTSTSSGARLLVTTLLLGIFVRLML